MTDPISTRMDWKDAYIAVPGPSIEVVMDAVIYQMQPQGGISRLLQRNSAPHVRT